ncbi:MAG: phosphoethanolamine transferase [Bacteroidaceae bacterium]|nr:phosphoethanolamine transferase [Bacteroidaceae bacterium]
MKKMFGNVCSSQFLRNLCAISAPVTVQPVFFILIYVLLGGLDIFFDGGFPLLSPIQKIIFTFFITYILFIPVLFLPRYLKSVYKFIILLISAIQFLVDIYLVILYGETFSTLHVDMVAAIGGTNSNEAREYLTTYLTIDKIFIILFVISILSLLYYYLNRLRIEFNSFLRCFISLLVLISVSVSVVQWRKMVLGNIYFLLRMDNKDLNEYRQNPVVVCSGDLPEYVVLLIGESFSKQQSSLYGYDKKTNPLLGKMNDEGRLVVYNNVKSAYTKTVPAVKSIMTSCVDEMTNVKWYEYPTLIEIMQRAGYRAEWISNQNREGLFDNEVTAFALLCDKLVYANEREGLSGYDECLLHLIDESIADKSSPKFLVVNMQGSHVLYSSRYSEKFAIFNAEDYVLSHPHLSQKSRTTLSEYDNSILYNDYVVYEIMQKFENEDAVLVYLSDHGQDIFNSSNDYAGHGIFANKESQAAAVNIPLMIYTSPLFKNKRPLLQERMEAAIDVAYRTDSIMYTIMDVVGVDSLNGVSYKKKSLIK